MTKYLAVFILFSSSIAASSHPLENCSAFAYEEAGISKDELRDNEKAIQKILPLAENGNRTAQYFLASYLYEDRPAEAMKWAKLSFENGCIDGALLLGVMYKEGAVTPQDKEGAFKWFLVAAEAGDAIAASMVSDMYYNGEGVEKNEEKSRCWLYVSRGEQ